MTGATIEDGNGTTINRTFNSAADFLSPGQPLPARATPDAHGP